MHSEAKQTLTLEFGAEKGLLQAPRKENEWLKTPKLPDGFWGEVLSFNKFLLSMCKERNVHQELFEVPEIHQ